MIFYHITQHHYVSSILTRGLIPVAELGLTPPGLIDVQAFRKSVVWLMQNIDFIRKSRCSPTYIAYEVLEIDCSGLDIKPYIIERSIKHHGAKRNYRHMSVGKPPRHVSTMSTLIKNEFIHYGTIAPHLINVLSYDAT